MVLGKFFDVLKRGLSRTKAFLGQPIRDLFAAFRQFDDEFKAKLEETLIGADVGVEATRKIVVGLEQAYKQKRIGTPDAALEYLKSDLRDRISRQGVDLRWAPQPPTVVLVCGVNGTGKTTSIAKLARLFRQDGKKVLLAAADTFRAAAVDQLTIWSERLGVDIVKHQTGADPGAVAYDAAEAAVSRGCDVLLVDTAGRLQTKEHLMKELTKIRNVLAKKISGAPHETLLVLDATTGQNALSQARHFHAATSLTGLFLAKLDGTAKGGIVVAIQDTFDLPVKFVGLGETPEDIARFDAHEFVEALFG